jgi:hypothetical protein
MTRVLIVAALLSCLILSAAVLAQEASSHKVKYVPKRPDPAFQEMKERDRLAADERRAETQKIRDAHAELAKKREAEERELRFDFTGVEKPTSPDVFQSVFHFEPVRQYLTGTCWCFSTTSFLESELYRLTGKKIKLSEMHTVYYEFLEKARRYVAERGDSFFDEGSEGNAVLMIWRKYGAVPAADYKGELNPDGRYDHSEMTEEMKDYLAYVKEKNYWDEATVIASLRAIMDRHMGSPPERIVYDSKELTPKQFLDEVLGLDLDQYVALMSTLSQPFYEYGEYEVPGNWWHSAEYYNLPLEEFYEVIKYAIRNGYSVRLNGDVSEGAAVRQQDDFGRPRRPPGGIYRCRGSRLVLDKGLGKLGAARAIQGVLLLQGRLHKAENADNHSAQRCSQSGGRQVRIGRDSAGRALRRAAPGVTPPAGAASPPHRWSADGRRSPRRHRPSSCPPAHEGLG